MNNIERIKAILNYQTYDRLPVVHFGFWQETLLKWYQQGHITNDEVVCWSDGNSADQTIGKKLGFDFNWYTCFCMNTGLYPVFERKIVEELSSDTRKVLDCNGVVILEKDGAGSIPAEIEHTLKDRKTWEDNYLPRLMYTEDRILQAPVNTDNGYRSFACGGKEYLCCESREMPIGLHCGSLLGQIRNWLGVEGMSYLYLDDEALFDEIIRTVGELSLRCTKAILEYGAKFDFGHFWEDICCKSGPLVIPSVFHQKVGPFYRSITDVLHSYGINIISVDCDGVIDSMIPTWFEAGVNTMFPIEVGTWGANIKPWRQKYGKELRGVGGMNKTVFSQDFAAVDAEIERLKPLVDLGGYIPCPDHRIAPDSKWDLVKYYCEKMRITFG